MENHELLENFKSTGIIEMYTGLDQSSPIYFGYNIQEKFLDQLENHSFDRLFFITDNNMYNKYGGTFWKMIHARYSNTKLLIVPDSDASKNFIYLESVCEELIEHGISKRSVVIAFGGGAVGNLVGMVSALIYRGIRYIEIPTTLTGITDSTLSNKQAINGKRGKNHFGTYYAPLFIWSDVKYLETESLRLRQSGLVEAIKNGFISNPEFLSYMEDILTNFSPLQLTGFKLFEVSYNIIQSKMKILQLDPSEKSYGIVLEYGHTFGHAIEWLAKGKLVHGEAVAIGMCIASELAHRLGYISQEIVNLHYKLMKKLELAVGVPPFIELPELMEIMLSDNKKTGEAVKYILLERIGNCLNPTGDYLVEIPKNTVMEVMLKYIRMHAIYSKEKAIESA
jgi:3-dehydroquinate synthetase